MSTRHERGPGRTRRDEVEDILGLGSGATTAEADALLALFADLDGPAQAGELPGEAAAVAAFRAARHSAPVAYAPARKRGRLLASLTTLLTFKTAAVALAATSVGGVALAASTGTLPTPHQHHSPKVPVEQPRTTTVVPTPTAAALRDAAKTAAALDRENAKAGKDRTASFGGLCTAFAAGNWDNSRAARNPAFARLVAAAPGGDVTDFCAALASESPAAPRSGNPAAGKPANPGQKQAAEKSKSSTHGKSHAAGSKVTTPQTKSKGKAADQAAGKGDAVPKRGSAKPR